MFDTGRDLYVFPVLFVIVVVGLLLEPRGSAAAGSTTKRCRPGRPPARCGPSRPSSGRSPPCAGRPPCPSPSSIALRPDAPALALGQQAPDRHGHRDHRHRRGLAGPAHRLGRPREPRSDGVRRGRGRRGRVGHPERRAGTSASPCWPAGLAGAVLAAVVGIPAARAGGLTLAVTTLALAPAVLFWLLNPEFFDWVPRGRFDSDPTLFGTIEIESQMSFYFLTLGVLAGADRGRLRDPAQPNRPRAHRAAGEPARRRGLRHQRAADDARRVRVLGLPRRDRRRAARPPPARGQPGRRSTTRSRPRRACGCSPSS